MKIQILRLFSRISPTSSPYVQFTKGFKNVESVPLPFFNESKNESRYLRYFTYIQQALALRREKNLGIGHCHNIYLLPAVIILKMATCFKFKIVFTLHTSFDLLKLRDKIILTLGLYFIDTLVSCGVAVKDSLPRYIRQNKRTATITNAVNLDALLGPQETPLFAVGSMANFERSGPSFYSACRLNRGKNIEENIAIIQALNELNFRAKYHIFGSGPLDDFLRERYTNESNILFHGLTSRVDLYSSIKSMDVFLSQSIGEGLPVAPLEALLLGKAAILSDIPPQREFVEFFPESLLIVDSQTDIDTIARFVNRWMKKPIPVENDVLDYFSLERMEREYINVYKK
jgi:glycosyltransferase involved in cell wall biosynthesis